MKNNLLDKEQVETNLWPLLTSVIFAFVFLCSPPELPECRTALPTGETDRTVVLLRVTFCKVGLDLDEQWLCLWWCNRPAVQGELQKMNQMRMRHHFQMQLQRAVLMAQRAFQQVWKDVGGEIINLYLISFDTNLKTLMFYTECFRSLNPPNFHPGDTLMYLKGQTCRWDGYKLFWNKSYCQWTCECSPEHQRCSFKIFKQAAN